MPSKTQETIMIDQASASVLSGVLGDQSFDFADERSNRFNPR